jgi:hypothetical protein
MTTVDHGILYVTNKRLIFTGSRRANTTIRLTSVLAITPYSDGVEIQKTTGRNQIFIFQNTDAEVGNAIISAALYQSDG